MSSSHFPQVGLFDPFNTKAIHRAAFSRHSPATVAVAAEGGSGDAHLVNFGSSAAITSPAAATAKSTRPTETTSTPDRHFPSALLPPSFRRSLSSVHLLQPSTLFPLHVFFQAAMFFRSLQLLSPLHSSLLSSGVDKTSLYASGGGGSERVSSASRTASLAPTLPLSPSSLALSCLFFSLFHFRSKCDCSYRARPLARSPSPSLPRARPLRSLEAASTAHSFSALFLSLSWAKRGCTFFLPSVVGLIPHRPTERPRPSVRSLGRPRKLRRLHRPRR